LPTTTVKRGAKVELETGAKKVKVCPGWNVDKYINNGISFDLNLFALILTKDANGKEIVLGLDQLVAFDQASVLSGSINHSGINSSGTLKSSKGEMVDEFITIEFDKIPEKFHKIVIVSAIHNARQRSQNFSMVGNAFCEVIDAENGNPLLRFEMDNNYSTETALVVCEIYRYRNGWKYSAVGRGHTKGFAKICYDYGIDAQD